MSFSYLFAIVGSLILLAYAVHNDKQIENRRRERTYPCVTSNIGAGIDMKMCYAFGPLFGFLLGGFVGGIVIDTVTSLT